MSRNDYDYVEQLLARMSPELMRRIEVVAEAQKKSVEDIIVKFLTEGANTSYYIAGRC